MKISLRARAVRPRAMLAQLSKIFAAAALIVAAQLFGPSAAQAQFVQGTANKIVGSNSVGNSNQGIVAISRDGLTALVGGPSDDGSKGAAWVFVFSGGNWVEQTKLIGGDVVGADGTQQGTSVALSGDGNLAVVSGVADDSVKGAVWVFTRSGGTWDAGVKLVGSTTGGGSRFGSSVAISSDGSTVIVGALNHNGNQGGVWVFGANGVGGWVEQAILLGTENEGAAQQGAAVALSADGNTVLVGGNTDDTIRGAAWVFTRGTGWTQQQKLNPAAMSGVGGLGSSVALSADGNTAMLGGPSSTGGGSWIFTRSGETWTEQTSLVGSDNVGNARQGISVALSADGNTAIHGGYFDDSLNGAVWVFVRSSGTWGQQGSKLVGSGATASAFQGNTVGLSGDGNTAIWGAQQDSGGVGASWIFYQLPTLTNVSPVEGPAAGGQTVTLTGTGFTGAESTPSGILFGANPATSITVIDPNHMTVVTPAHAAGAVNIVTANAVASINTNNAYTYLAAPHISSISPGNGPVAGGTSVVITGTGFTPGSTVKFGTTDAASVDYDSPTKLTVITPARAAGTVGVHVTTVGGTDTVAGGFTFYALPTVTGLNPNSDYVTGGATVTITGTNLSAATDVKFGTVSGPITSATATKIIVTAPAHAVGVVNVRVVTPGGTTAVTAASRFTYQALPVVTSLYKFKGTSANDGATPVGWLIQDNAGNLYGVTQYGGSGNFGSVFRLAPPVPPKTMWTRTNLHIFSDGPGDGAGPRSGLFADTTGRLYGTTDGGGTFGNGTVFRLTRPPAGNPSAKWKYELLYSFNGAAGDGMGPQAGVVVDANGVVYGSTVAGGAADKGTLFRLTPAATPPWTHKRLYSFTGAPAGAVPVGRLSIDTNGVLRGTTKEGGRFNKGAVYKFTPPAGAATARPVLLYSFKATGNDGNTPLYGGIATDADGGLYGTTNLGGLDNEGTVFKLTPTTPAATQFTESRLYDFKGNFDGGLLYYGVVPGKNGSFLGTSNFGTFSGQGLVYKLLPPTGGQTKWTKRSVYDFEVSDPAGGGPFSDLLIGKGNVIYGATNRGGGPCNCGAVFMIKE